MKENVLIIGFGSSGKWAYNLGLKWGYMPLIYDDEFMSVETIQDNLQNVSFAVVSPAVNRFHPLIIKLKELAIPVISEIEFAYYFRNENSKIIGVTGTNGKTTVVRMIQSILGKGSELAGNIGIPYSKVVGCEKENMILELSSFQLENIRAFTPDIAVFTNFAPDHIDYHGSYENYINAKLNLIKNRNKDTIIIYNGEDNSLSEKIEECYHANSFYFSTQKLHGFGIYCEQGKVVVSSLKGECVLYDLKDLGEISHHNLLNALASSLVASLLGVNTENIVKGLKSFVPSPYRQQPVKNNLGVTIINDSKSTNLMATLTALDSCKGNKYLIVGGKPKNEDYSKLFKGHDNLLRVVAFGESRFEFEKCAIKNGYKNITIVERLKDAVEVVVPLMKKGDVLLFSPACASFDQFSSYVERGKKFDEIISKYKKLG